VFNSDHIIQTQNLLGRNNMTDNATIVLMDVEIYFAKLDPERPNSRFDKDRPTWEIQIRTKDKAVAKDWKAKDLRVTTDDNDDGVFYRVNLKKRSKKADGTNTKPVNVVAGDLSPIDPKTIGNGSRGNLSIFQYDYKVNNKEGRASMLMGIQVTLHNEYTPKPMDGGFAPTEYKVNKIEDNHDADDDMVSGKNDDLDDDINF